MANPYPEFVNLSLNVFKKFMGVTLIKRMFDLCVSGVALLLLWPVVLLVAFIVLLDLGWPVLFIQERPGFKGRIFRVYKFRTMRQPNPDGLLDEGDAERMTRVGKFLRSTSLDELPQLWNVFKGNMSLVGPRPLLKEYLPLYSANQARRHDVKPGITGWAQVNGRNNLSWQEKFEFDIWYVDNQSFCLDMQILLKTVRKVLGRKDISSDDHATSVRFEGNDH